MNYPAKMPVFYWRERVAPTKLCINKLKSFIALIVGQLNLTFDDESSCTKLGSESSDSDSDESISAPAPADKSYVEVETSARMNPTGTVDFDSS
jgi:hypothetical protein